MATKAPKLKERSKILTINPFRYTVVIVLTNDVQESAKRRNLTDDAIEHAYAFHASSCGPRSLLVLPFQCGVDTVAHEVSHCVWRIMEVIGADHENEVMAYTHGYLVGEICEFMKKHRTNGWKTIRSKP